ncbi:hypothetical protein P4E94_18815, partial [Pontiellaceae bacterium B12219]|nr:hypothetical protein [Pontiellaceae bacterium B12219]
MRKSVVSAGIALLSGAVAQAATLKENSVFPDTNLITSQTNWNSQLGLQDRLINGNPTDLSIGQSFKIESPTTLRAITLQNHQDRSWGEGTHALELWIGENDGSASNFVAGATKLVTTIDLENTSIAALDYLSFNLDSDLALPAGDYGFQLNWTSQDAANFMYAKRIDGGTNYIDGGWLYDTTVGGTLPFDDADSPIANDLVFALHTAAVSTVPIFTVEPDELTVLVGPADNQVTGSVAVAYTADSTVEIAVSISDESHPGSFSLLSASPQTLTEQVPSNTVLQFEFDNTVSNLTAGTSATGLATIAWTVTGSGVTNETVVPLTANTGFEPDANNTFVPVVGSWGDSENWSLGRVPGTLGADRGIIQNEGLICNVDANFTGLFPFRVWIRTASGTPSVFNINADLMGMADISVGQAASQYGILNHTAGAVEVDSIIIAHSTGTAPLNSVYTQTGGSAEVNALTVNPTGELKLNGGSMDVATSISVAAGSAIDIDGGSLNFDVEPANRNLGVTGSQINLKSGSFTTYGPNGDDVLNFNADFEISGGSLDLNGQNKFSNQLKVIGDAATIEINNFNSAVGGVIGDIVYVMGETGISTIVNTGFGHLQQYAITVDGSAYAGGSGTFVLFDSGYLASTSTSVTVTGFAEGITAVVVQDQATDEVTLNVTVPGYAGWIGGYGLSGTDADWNVDYDGDTENNFYEYAFG